MRKSTQFMEAPPFQAKYKHLAHVLKEKLRYQPVGKKLASVRALMKRFQVSQHTVMAALHVLEEEELISRKHGSGVYRSNVDRLPMIAFCRPNANSVEIEGEENALLAACKKRGWKMSVHYFDSEHVDLFADEIDADGFIILPEIVTFQSPLLARVSKNNIPLIVLGRNTGSSGLDFVTGNDAGILNDYVRGLVERGHQRIGLLVSETHFYEIEERIKVFNRLCEAFGVEGHVLDPQIGYGENCKLRSENFLREYLEAQPAPLPFTALVTCSLGGSIPALRVLHDNGIKVPADCSICCMGTDPDAQYSIPSLTNGTRHHAEMAEACLRLLDLRIKGDTSPLLSEIVPYFPSWRESCGDAPTKRSPKNGHAKRSAHE